MQHRFLWFVAAGIVASVWLSGCGDTRTRLSQEEIDEMRSELLELAERADFRFEHRSYADAKKDYAQVVKKAKEFLYYGEHDSGIEAMLERAKQRLESEEMAEGLLGKIRIGGRWVDPAVYYVEKSSELRGRAGNALAKRMIELRDALLESKPAPGRALESDEAKAILEIGKDATPFVAGWLECDDREARRTALLLLDAMEDNEKIIFSAALAHLGSDSPSIVRQSVRLLSRFPCDETDAALVPLLDGNDERLLDEVVITLCETKTELGRRVLFEKARGASKLSLVRQVVLKHIYLLNSREAVELLADAVKEAAEDANQAYIKKVATKSLLKMDMPEMLPAYTDILQGAGRSDREMVIKILERIRDASYAPAEDAVARTFTLFSDDQEIAELAVDVMEKTADCSSIKSLINMVLAMDIKTGDMAQELDAESIFARITNIIKRIRDKNTADRFMDLLSPYQSPETVSRAAHALGVLEEESAVPKLWEVYQSSSNNMVKIAVVNALARIGSPASMERVALVIKTEPPGDVLKYATEQMPKVVVNLHAFEALFRKLDGAAPETVRALFDTTVRHRGDMALVALLITASMGEDYLRYEALRALASLKGKLTDEQAEVLVMILQENVVGLQGELDVARVGEAFDCLKMHVDNAMPVFLTAVRAQHWSLRYYSAQALAAASAESAGKHRAEIRAIYRELLKKNDYLTALWLARCLRLPKEEQERIIRAHEERLNKLLESTPAGVGLNVSLKDVKEKLGEDFAAVGPKGSTAHYLHYRSLGLVFAFVRDRKSREQRVRGIGYTKGFKGDIFGVKIGDNFSNILMIATPLSGDASQGLRYHEELDAFLGDDPASRRTVFYILNRDRTIRYVAEVSHDADEEFGREFKKVLDAVRLDAATEPEHRPD